MKPSNSIITSLDRGKCNLLYNEVFRDEDHDTIRELTLCDLFFLLTRMCKRADINNDWLFDRCREVEASPDGHLDLWAREHYKSTIITFGKSIQDILNNPEITIGIFSHVKPIAKAFLRQIKIELEDNTLLKAEFPDILYKEPHKESPCWSLDNGITVKRKTNPKEQTIEANGLVDGQPTSKHYLLNLYDDVVTIESVSTPDQIKKVTDAWAMSLNLGANGGAKRYIGTRYHTHDTYREMMERGSVKPRIHPATDNGKTDGNPVFLPREVLAEKRRDFGPYIFASQMLQNPTEDAAQGFKEEWLAYYNPFEFNFSGMNLYLLCDPAGEKKKENDYTCICVIGLGADQNYYLIDGVRDRLNLTERTKKIFEFHDKYKPVGTGYEKYGKDSDIEHIEAEQNRLNYRFDIKALGGPMAKNDRIKKLVPVFENHRFYLPKFLKFLDYENKTHNYIDEFVKEEYLTFPVAKHDDMFDCKARIVDPKLEAVFPKGKAENPLRGLINKNKQLRRALKL